jgi:cytochrome c-type biogenesis protein CcmH/NrfG
MIAFEQAVRLDPKNLSGRVLWGWTLHLAGEDAQAAVVLRKNFALDPYHGETLNALGIVYLFQDQVWPAVLTHSWAALLQPDNEIPFYNLSLGFQRLGLHDWAIATGEYASVLEPNNPHPLLATALAYGSRRSLTDPHTHHQVTQLFQATLALDGRYGDPAFWLHLREADFSLPQIAAVTTLWQQVISPP